MYILKPFQMDIKQQHFLVRNHNIF